MMDVGDPAGDGILDRNHAEIGLARGDHGKRILEGRAGQRLGLGIGFGDGDMGIGAGLALERDLEGLGHVAFLPRLVAAAQRLERMLRAVSRSAGVSTPRGTVSTMVMSILSPASRARSCSSFSCRSRGEGGRRTKRSSAA